MDARQLHTLGIAAGRALDGYGSGQMHGSDAADPYSYLKGFDPRDYDCKAGESDEQCQKRLFEQRALVACKVCAAIFTDGLAVPACGAINPIVSSIVWVATGWLEKPIGKLLGWLFGGLSSLAARPVFEPMYEISVLWKGTEDPLAPHDGGPVSKAWIKAVDSLQTAWDDVRASKGLEPSPLKYQTNLVTRLADEIWPLPPVAKAISGLQSIPETMTPAEALAYMCYRDTTPQSGWGAAIMQDWGNGKGNVGYVYSGANNKGDVFKVFWGEGPFAFTSIENWGEDCNETNCINAFRDDVYAVWAARLQCVARAMPAMVALTTTQLEWQQKQEKSALVTTAKVAALGGAAYAAWHFWPQILSFGTKLIRKL